MFGGEFDLFFLEEFFLRLECLYYLTWLYCWPDFRPAEPPLRRTSDRSREEELPWYSHDLRWFLYLDMAGPFESL